MSETPNDLKRKIRGKIRMAVEVNVAAHMYRLCGQFPWMEHEDIVKFLVFGRKDKKGNIDSPDRQAARFYTWDLYINQHEVSESGFLDSMRERWNGHLTQKKIYRPFKMRMVEIAYHRWMGNDISFENCFEWEIRCIACGDPVIDIPAQWRTSVPSHRHAKGQASSTKGLCVPCERMARRVIREVDPTARSHVFWKEAPTETRALILEMIVARRLQHSCAAIRPWWKMPHPQPPRIT